jgi:hypothetical protein
MRTVSIDFILRMFIYLFGNQIIQPCNRNGLLDYSCPCVTNIFFMQEPSDLLINLVLEGCYKLKTGVRILQFHGKLQRIVKPHDCMTDRRH